MVRQRIQLRSRGGVRPDTQPDIILYGGATELRLRTPSRPRPDGRSDAGGVEGVERVRCQQGSQSRVVGGVVRCVLLLLDLSSHIVGQADQDLSHFLWKMEPASFADSYVCVVFW